MKVTATNKATGEVIELPADTVEQMIEAWQIVQAYEKTASALKDQLKRLVSDNTDSKGRSLEHKGFAFRVISIQRVNYDKAAMRELLDPDTFDVLLKPDKPAIDKYLKENLESLGNASTQLRRAMVAEGKPYEVIRLERVARDDTGR